MSKFLLNLLLQISKALVNSKIQFLIQKFFFLDFGPADLAAHPAFQPSQPTGRAIPRRPKAPGLPIQPARRSHLHGKYVFLFRSRLPEPTASSLCHRHTGPTCQLHRLPRAGRPRSEFSPRRCSPVPLPHTLDAPELLQLSLITPPS
jgi:hypothetical protein